MAKYRSFSGGKFSRSLIASLLAFVLLSASLAAAVAATSQRVELDGLTFEVIDAESDLVVGYLSDDVTVLDLNSVPSGIVSFSLVGAPSDTESIRFEVSGPERYGRLENVAPYSVFGNQGSDHNGRKLSEGTYSVSVRAFSEDSAKGSTLARKSFKFAVVDPIVVTTDTSPTIMIESLPDITVAPPAEAPVLSEASASVKAPVPVEAPTATKQVTPETPVPEVLTDAALASISDFTYQGAFGLSSDEFGASSTNYAVGTLAFNFANQSLFMVGHASDNAVAEFAIPSQLGSGRDVAKLPVVAKPLQPFATVLDRVPNPDQLDRITGMYVHDGSLLVNAEQWYDAGADAKDTSLVISDANNLQGKITGYYELSGGAKAAGYVSPVPAEWQSTIGSSVLTGWASNYSIISRYSVGPSIFSFDPDELANNSADKIDTDAKMVFPQDAQIVSNAWDMSRGSASPLWNSLSRGVYGFIIPGTRTFAVVGSSGGIESGIGYKITQDDGTLCPGPCAYEATDVYNYYWLFDLDEIAQAKSDSDPRPYEVGRWSVPFDNNGQHRISGATFDPNSSTLYMSLGNAGQIGNYARPPLIVAYKIG